MELAIIGKHPSVETYTAEIFKSFEHTLGLNHAAILFDTKYALWMQIRESLYRPYYKGEKIVTIPKPPDARQKRDHCFQELCYTHKADTMDVGSAVRNSILTKDREYQYTSVNTCLHLALFWAMLENFTTIHLFGCNNTPVEGGKEWDWASAHQVTAEIIRVANRYGVTIHWWESGLEYLHWKQTTIPAHAP